MIHYDRTVLTELVFAFGLQEQLRSIFCHMDLPLSYYENREKGYFTEKRVISEHRTTDLSIHR